ncbi:MAG: DUF1552 domain-containing protein [Deltaproteobacteria bacterium]
MKLSRRTLLKGALGGATVTVGLPALECMLNSHGTALANGTLPKRFGIWFWGNGVLPAKWVPTGEGTEWTLSDQLSPLADVKDDISVVSGMSVKTGNAIPHGSGPGGIFSGAPLILQGGEEYTFSTPSIDQFIAREIGGETRFRSLELGAKPGPGLSFNGPNSKNPPESSPRRFFDRIFGGNFTLPGDDPTPDPRLRLRRSVLDAVMGDVGRLNARLSMHDKQRLDQHLTGIRDLERRLERLEQNPPSLESCALPDRPAETFPDVDGRPPMPEIARAMADVLALALACDQTRVFSFWFTYPVNNVLFPGMPAGHHRLTHDEPGEQPMVNDIVKLITTELAYFVARLKSIPEGDATLLDSCAVLATSDTSWGRNHTLDDYPIVIAGNACGALRKGVHYRSPSNENASMVLLSLVRAMGIPAAEYGAEAGHVDRSLGAIEA